jgi:hypothetical protein
VRLRSGYGRQSLSLDEADQRLAQFLFFPVSEWQDDFRQEELGKKPGKSQFLSLDDALC